MKAEMPDDGTTSDRLLRVALISDADGFGGAEQYLVHLAQALKARVQYIVLLSDRAPAETRRRLEGAGAWVQTVNGLARRPSPGSFGRVNAAIRSIRPDLVHVNMTDQRDGLSTLAAARLSRRPVVATLHLVLPRRSMWREAIARVGVRAADRMIAVSDGVDTYLRALGAATTVVWNGIAPPILRRDPRHGLGLDHDGLVVGGIGRLDAQKGWDVLCEATRIVSKRVPDIRFVVIGDGPERACLERSAGGRIQFLGYREAASSFLRAFDVLVIPSNYEGLPLVAMEGLSAGVPIICSNVEGLAEVVNGCGMLVPAGDVRALAVAIMDLVEDPQRRAELGRAGIQRAQSLFNIERCAEETFAVYTKVALG
jgi:glycosyltransferase involved in cell wall biosynthesis